MSSSIGGSKVSSLFGSALVGNWPSSTSNLLADENERGDDPNEVAAVDAVLIGDALVS